MGRAVREWKVTTLAPAGFSTANQKNFMPAWPRHKNFIFQLFHTSQGTVPQRTGIMAFAVFNQ
jgi:hypothetical protein